MKLFFQAAIILLAVAVIFIPVVAEDSHDPDAGNVPEKVTAALEKAYPDAEIGDVESEEIDGRVYYEFEVADGDNELTVSYFDDGTLYEIEEYIEVEDLPKIIINALHEAYPHGEIDETDKITRGGITEYEAIVWVDTDEEEIEFEVTVSSDGKIISAVQITDDDEGDQGNEGDDDEGTVEDEEDND